MNKLIRGGGKILISHISRTDESKRIRKENMKKGKDYSPFQGKQIDFKEGETMNTITCATQKDNLVIQLNPSLESGGKQPYQHNRVYSTDGLIPNLDLDPRKNIFTEGMIRRLTEVECERLQGYPDDWTKYGNYDGVVKEICKSQRYKLCGNAVTRNIVELIGKKLIINF